LIETGAQKKNLQSRGRAGQRAQLGGAGVTSSALRHSSIVRALLGGVPVAVTAQQHDTSVREIEARYAAFILDHSDSLARRTLLDTAVPVMADDVLHSKAGALT
jgi:hypothetical protein